MRYFFPGFAAALIVATSTCSSGPTGPSESATAPIPVTLPTSLSRGDIYRITFRVSPTAWPVSYRPDVLVVHPGGGSATCRGGDIAIDIFDGPTRLGAQPDGICASNLLYGLDFGPIRSGAINGRVDIRITGVSATFSSFWELATCLQTGLGAFSCQGDSGLLIESRSIVKGQSTETPPSTAGAAPDFSNAGYSAPLNPFDQFGATWYECTRYAWGRAYEKLGIQATFNATSGRHGGKWYDLITDGFQRGTSVRANSLAVWSDGDGTNDFGHVAFVESVGASTATVSEANLDLQGHYSGTTAIPLSKMQIGSDRVGFGLGSNYKLVGFVYLD